VDINLTPSQTNTPPVQSDDANAKTPPRNQGSNANQQDPASLYSPVKKANAKLVQGANNTPQDADTALYANARDILKEPDAEVA